MLLAVDLPHRGLGHRETSSPMAQPQGSRKQLHLCFPLLFSQAPNSVDGGHHFWGCSSVVQFCCSIFISTLSDVDTALTPVAICLGLSPMRGAPRLGAGVLRLPGAGRPYFGTLTSPRGDS